MPMPDRFTVAAAGFFALGLALVVLSVLRGEGSAGIAICIPFFFGTGLLASLGVLCFFGGTVLLFSGMARIAAEAAGEGGAETGPGPGGTGPPAAPEGHGRPPPADPQPAGPPPADPRSAPPRARAGGVILLGPIPIVFGSDPGISRAMFYIALGLMATLIAVMLLAAFL